MNKIKSKTKIYKTPEIPQENIVDYDKVLNSRCSCNKGLSWIKGEIVMAYPCEHMFHEKCYNNFKKLICPICKECIEKKLTLFDENLHHQRFADLLSMTYFDNMSNTTPGRFLDSIFDLASILARLPIVTNKSDVK